MDPSIEIRRCGSADSVIYKRSSQARAEGLSPGRLGEAMRRGHDPISVSIFFFLLLALNYALRIDHMVHNDKNALLLMTVVLVILGGLIFWIMVNKNMRTPKKQMVMGILAIIQLGILVPFLYMIPK
jgi:hypothetical protein